MIESGIQIERDIMPNWVYNGLTIEGNPDSVNKLVEQVGKSFTMPVENREMGDVIPSGGFPTKIKEVTYTNPIFAFWNILSPYDQDITAEEYAKQPVYSKLDVNDKDWWSDTERLRMQDKSWYSWNITNWGTKWDVAVGDDEKYPDTYTEGPTEIGDRAMVFYNFNTAWSIPDQVLLKLSSQYPDLDMTLSYEEETGWGGERIYTGGNVVSESEYGWKCRDCDHEEEETPYCETCDWDMCPSCGWGEPMDEDRALCETHKEKVEA